VKLLEEMWSDSSMSQKQSSSIAGKIEQHVVSRIKFFLCTENVLKAMHFSAPKERNFNERLLVSLGFVKVREQVVL
jgi:hypothetical protein